jgi:HEAT repeat protein
MMPSDSKMDIERAASLLKSTLPADKISAIDYIESNPCKKSIDLLICTFNDQNWTIRQKASETLVRISKKFTDYLISVSQLENLSSDQVYWLLKSLSFYPEKAERLINDQIQNENAEIRRMAIIIAGKSNIKSSVNILIKSFGDPFWIIRKTASESLIKIGTSVFNQIQKVFLSVYKSPEKEDVSYWCARTMGKLWPDGIIKGYVKFLKSKDEKLRYYAYTALRYCGDKRCLPFLVPGLKDSSYQCRSMAEKGIIQFKALSLDYLLSFYKESPESEKKELAAIIGKVCTEENFKRTFQFITACASYDAKIFSLVFLKNVNAQTRELYFLSFFKDSRWFIRDAASRVMAESGAGNIEILLKGIKHSNEDIVYWSIITIGRIGGSRALNILKKISSSPDKFIQSAVISSLENVYNDEALDILILMLSSQNWSVRSQAVNAVIKRGEKIIPRLMEVFAQKDSNTVYWAMQILISFGDTAVDSLLQIFKGSDNDARSQAVLALGMIASDRSVREIAGLFNNSDEHEGYFIVKALAGADSFLLVEKIVHFFPEFEDKVCRWFSLVLQNICKISVSPLLKLLDSNEDSKITFWILKALKNTKNSSVKECMHKYLRHDNVNVRLEALEAITEIVDTSFAEDLIFLLDDNNVEIKKYALNMLISMGDAKMFFHLFEIIDNIGNDSDFNMIKYVEEGIIKSERNELIDHLFNVLRQCSPEDQRILRTVERIIAFKADADKEVFTKMLNLVNVSETEKFITSIINCIGICKTRSDYEIWVKKFREFNSENVKIKLMDLISEYLISGDSETKSGIGIFVKSKLYENCKYLLMIYNITDNTMKKMAISQFIENIGSDMLKLLEQFSKDPDQNLSKASSELYKALKVSLLG